MKNLRIVGWGTLTTEHCEIYKDDSCFRFSSVYVTYEDESGYDVDMLPACRSCASDATDKVKEVFASVLKK